MSNNLLDENKMISLLKQGLLELQLSADEQKTQQLLAYVELLLHWNKTYNLTAAESAEEIIIRHILDSLTVLPMVKGKLVVDVGSGAGFPGVVLAVFLPDVSVIVLDSNNKKTRFLTQVKVALKLKNLEVVHQRIEDFQRDNIDIIVSRAFSSLIDFVKMTDHLQQKGHTKWVAMKGKHPEEELRQLPTELKVEMNTVKAPLDTIQRHIITLWWNN